MADLHALEQRRDLAAVHAVQAVEPVEQMEVGEDGGEQVAVLGEVALVDRPAVPEHDAGTRLVEAGEQADQGRLAAAVAADDEQDLARAHLEIDRTDPEHLLPVGIEIAVAQHPARDPVAQGGAARRGRKVGPLVGLIQALLQPGEAFDREVGLGQHRQGTQDDLDRRAHEDDDVDDLGGDLRGLEIVRQAEDERADQDVEEDVGDIRTGIEAPRRIDPVVVRGGRAAHEIVLVQILAARRAELDLLEAAQEVAEGAVELDVRLGGEGTDSAPVNMEANV